MNYLTIDGFEKLSAQEIFNQVRAHLEKQGCQSIEDGHCLYRGPEGRKCAAGIFLKDNVGFFNGLPWSSLEENGLVPRHHVALISRLQSIHDTYRSDTSSWEQWLDKELQQVASEYGLTYK